MKMIISLQDGSVYMLSLNQIYNIEFCASFVKIVRVAHETELYFYKDIKSIVIA